MNSVILQKIWLMTIHVLRFPYSTDENFSRKGATYRQPYLWGTLEKRAERLHWRLPEYRTMVKWGRYMAQCHRWTKPNLGQNRDKSKAKILPSTDMTPLLLSWVLRCLPSSTVGSIIRAISWFRNAFTEVLFIYTVSKGITNRLWNDKQNGKQNWYQNSF